VHLHEGAAESRDRLADDQRVHFARSLVRIDGLCICDEASDVLVLPQALVAAFKFKGKVGMFRWQLYQEAKLIF
jgi:hypothetical protein